MILHQYLDRKPLVSMRDSLKSAAMWFSALVFAVVNIYANIDALEGMAGAPRSILEWTSVFFIFVAAFCVIGLLAVMKNHFRRMKFETCFVETKLKLENALREGMVSSRKCSTTSVIVIEHFEYWANGYIFDVGNGQSLLLKGQTYWDTSNPAWPNSEFEIVRTSNGAFELGLFCTGHQLEPVRTLDICECIDDFIWTSREELFSEPPDAVLKKFLKPKATQS